MIATLGYCLRDEEITLELARWIKDLGGCPSHDLFLIHDRRCNKNLVQTILDAFIPSFKAVYPGEAPAEIDGWPQGANYFLRIMSCMLQSKPYNEFLWLEPDAIPLVPNWMDSIEKEYRGCGRPFLGDRVDVENIDLHMSGIGVYKNPLYEHAGEAYRATEVAFDMAGKDQIVPKAHFTKLIEHAWKHPEFTMMSELQTQIRKEAVLFHASKDGSLIRLLRQKLFPAVPVLANDTTLNPSKDVEAREGKSSKVTEKDRTVSDSRGSKETNYHPKASLDTYPGEGAAKQPGTAPSTLCEVGTVGKDPIATAMADRTSDRSTNLGGGGERQTEVEVRANAPVSRYPQRHDPPQPASPTCDIFIRTYHGDVHWLVYCLKAIRKFASGFRKVWVVSPEADAFGLFANDPLIEWKQMNDETEDGYLAQQITKLYADVITDYAADYILHIDSDVILTRPITPQSFLTTGSEQRVIWPYTPYDSIETPWQPITEKFMNTDVENEFMRRFPIMIPRWLYSRLREFAFKLHKMPIADYIRNQPHRAFSEFNALGAYAYAKHRDRFMWLNTQECALPAPYARQFHSYSGITPEVKAEIETILSGGVESRHAVDDNAGKASQPTTPTEINRAVQSVNRNNASSGSSAPPAQTSLPVPVLAAPSGSIPASHVKCGATRESTAEEETAFQDSRVGQTSLRGMESKPAAHHHTQDGESSSPSVPSQIKVLPNGLWVLHGDQISEWVEQEGRLDHDQNLLPKILEHIKPGDVVLDVGAFIGDHTVAYSRAVGEAGRVVAFEPNPMALQCLLHNTMPLKNVQVSQAGLSDRKELVPLSGNNGNHGGAYVGEHMKVAEVELDRLDDFRLAPTSLIKIDVEGYELKVLRGAEKTIARYRPKLVIEINEEALRRQDANVSGIFQWLENHGYTFSIMQENCDAFSPLYDILALPLEVANDKVVRAEVTEKEPGSSPGAPSNDGIHFLHVDEPPSEVEQRLNMSLSIMDHVKELEAYGRQGIEQMKYVRKLLKKRGIMPMARRR